MHIGQTNPSYSDPLLEAVDIRQIYDKFPEKKGGLKELYERGPQNSFFLVKFWVCCWEGYGGEGHPQATGSLWVGDILGSSRPCGELGVVVRHGTLSPFPLSRRI